MGDGQAHRRTAGLQPASETKDVNLLEYSVAGLDCIFSLAQDSTNGSTTGTTLWLSSQILACYLQAHYDVRANAKKQDAKPVHVVELGAGIGLLSLVLQRLGWHVTATDIEPSLSMALRPNVERNALRNGTDLTVLALDWTKVKDADDLLAVPPSPLIITADTVYTPALVDGLFRTIALLLRREEAKADAEERRREGRRKGRGGPCAIVALERRDAGQIEKALDHARQAHSLQLQQISPRLVRKAVDAYLGATWPRDVWEGVELWQVQAH